MAQDSWKEVRSKVEGLGLKLKLHLEQEADEADSESTPGDTKRAIEELGEKLQEAFASFGHAAKDPAVRSDMKDIGALLKDAMMETFSNVSAEVGDTLKKAGGRGQGTAPEGAADTAPEGAADTAPEGAADTPSEGAAEGGDTTERTDS